MLQKNVISLGISLGILFLLIATFYYPGGSLQNEFSQGYSWTENYISNLLRPLAVNGKDNAARPWAIVGVLFLTSSFGLFFVQFSDYIQVKSAAFIIKYVGIVATFLGFLTVIPSLHDIMVTVTSVMTLLLFFYLTVIAIKAKMPILSIASVFFLSLFYLATFMYFGRFHLEYMPIMQKIILLAKIVWILSLTYFTTKDDFKHVLK
jgi:hypothetical protein